MNRCLVAAPVLVMAEALLAGAATPGAITTPLMQIETGWDEWGTPLVIPSIDPTGITYHHPSGHLFIVDSEIDEVAEVYNSVLANVFEISPTGDTLYGAYDLRLAIPRNSEPAGIAYNPLDGYFYATNDSSNRVYRYAFTPGVGFTVDDYFKHTYHEAGSNDPEGITVDTTTGMLYIVDGNAARLLPFYYDENGEPRPGDSGPPGSFVFLTPIELHALNEPQNVPRDPTGIAFDPLSGNFVLVSRRDKSLFEYTPEGLFVACYDLSAFKPRLDSPQDLAFAPTGHLVGATAEQVVYIVDAGVDNNIDSSERDGTIFVAQLSKVNVPPVIDLIPDLVVEEGGVVSLAVSASDFNFGDRLTFSLVGAVPEGASIDPVTGQFWWSPAEAQAPGGHLVNVRVTDDGIPPEFSEATFVVTTLEVNLPPVLEPVGDITVAPGADVAFPVSAADPDLEPALQEGLRAYWSFDSGAERVRSATGAHDGLQLEGAAIERGPGGYMLGGGALSLDGVNAYVSFGDIALPGDFTIAAWIFPENIGSRTTSQAVILGDGADQDWMRLQNDGIRVKFAGQKNTFNTTTDFVNGSWQHFALVRSGGAVTVYRDAEVVDSGEIHSMPFTPEWIGKKKPTTNHFMGLIDDMAIWDRSLRADEIAPLHGGGAGRAVGDAGTVAANTLSFGLEGAATGAASIDATTGFFGWTAPMEPGDYAFTVIVSDDGDPPLVDEQTFTVTVASTESAEIAGASVAAGGTCPDLDGNGWVGIGDLMGLLAAWAREGGPDIDGDGGVGVSDIEAILEAWGPCP